MSGGIMSGGPQSVSAAVEAVTAKIKTLFDRERDLIFAFRENWIHPLQMSEEERKNLLKRRNMVFFFLMVLMERYSITDNKMFSTVAVLLDIIMYSRVASNELKSSIHMPLSIFMLACKFHSSLTPSMVDLAFCQTFITHSQIPEFMLDSLNTLTHRSLLVKEREVLRCLNFNIFFVDFETFANEVISMAPQDWKRQYGEALDAFISHVVGRVSLCHIRPSLVVAVCVDAVAWYCMRPARTLTIYDLAFIPLVFKTYAAAKRVVVESYRTWFNEFGAQIGRIG